MDWNAAIEKNREALKRVLAMLVATAGLAGPDPKSPFLLWGGVRGGGQRPRELRHSFPLFDPLRRFHRRRPARCRVPRISFPGFSEPFRIPPPPSPDDPVNATRLALRLAALARVLDDLPREARRFARWRCRNAAQIEEGRNLFRERGRVRRVWPLRPGRPPGHRPGNRGPRHEVHDILDVTHGLAFWALEPSDTS